VRLARDFEITAIAGKTWQERPNRSQSTHYLMVWRSRGNRNQGDVICVHVLPRWWSCLRWRLPC
jgi:hypothetical protein